MARSGWCPPGAPEDGDTLAGDAADDGALAQQPDAELDAVLRALAPDSLPGGADRLARLEADRRLVERLRREDGTGAGAGKLLMAVYEYAHPVMSSLIGSGRIFRQCSRLGAL